MIVYNCSFACRLSYALRGWKSDCIMICASVTVFYTGNLIMMTRILSYVHFTTKCDHVRPRVPVARSLLRRLSDSRRLMPTRLCHKRFIVTERYSASPKILLASSMMPKSAHYIRIVYSRHTSAFTSAMSPGKLDL